MNQARAGRPVALFDRQRGEEHWYANQRSHLLAFCLTIVHDRQVAEDVVHETFARALAEGLPCDRRSGPWLRTVAHNLCIDHVRRSARFTEFAETEDLKAAEALERVGDAVDHSAQYAAVGAAFTALHARDRRVLWLRDVEGWDYPDIASADGSTARAVRTRAYRARALMRSRIAAVRARTLGIVFAILRPRSHRLEPNLGGSLVLAVRSLVLGVMIGGVGLMIGALSPLAISAGPTPVAKAERSEMGITTRAPQIEGRGIAVRTARVSGGARKRSPAGPVGVTFQNEHRRPNAVVPKRTYLSFEVRDPNGNVLFFHKFEHACDKEGPGLREQYGLGADGLIVGC